MITAFAINDTHTHILQTCHAQHTVAIVTLHNGMQREKKHFTILGLNGGWTSLLTSFCQSIIR